MDNLSILYPMFTLVLWTLAIAIVTIKRAYRAVGEGLNPEYFRYGEGFKAPGYMLSAYQHYSNLFEMPVLFYAVTLTIYTTQVNSALLLTLAWLYTFLRTLHSFYHLANTNIPRRRDTFIAGYSVLVLLWGITIMEIMQLA